MSKKFRYRAFLEVQGDDGQRYFVETKKILQSNDLQRRCVERATLRRIINRLQKHVLGQNQTRFDG